MFHTYITHYTKLVDRKKYIIDHLNGMGISDYSFITRYDKEDITEDLLLKHYNDSEDGWNEATSATGPAEYRRLNAAEISLAIKHVKTLGLFLESKHEYALVIEDDCFFYEGCRSELIEEIITGAPSGWDAIFPGGGFDHQILTIKSSTGSFMEKGSYLLVDHPASNTTSSIIYNRAGAEKTLSSSIPFAIAWDWHLNYAYKQNDLNIYHTNPYVCTQLSTQGLEKSAIRE